MFESDETFGEHGEAVAGPPWILGHRGSPREAPENTLASLRRAIDLGLDGVEYDVHGCASGEPVLIHDETLERTTDGHGPVSALTLPELAGIDAGGWFDRRFAGEPLPLLEEALELMGNDAGSFPQHMIELKDPRLVGEVARQLGELARPLTVRIASFHRSVCLEARDLGLPTMLLAVEALASDLAFVRDERISAYGTGPGGWGTPAGREEWPCERWSWSVDAPDDLLAACRAPLFGFNTNEPLRALATRALVRATPDDDGPYPLEVPPLEVPPWSGLVDGFGEHGQWSGRWRVDVRVRNPFPVPVEAALGIAIRGGAFEYAGLPVRVELAPGERASAPLELSGGSWSPGEDPTVFVRFVWQRASGAARESLVLDAPLARTRTVTLSDDSLRLTMLAERPGAPRASMTVRRRGRDLLAWVEDPGGLTDVRACVRLQTEIRYGGHGVRVRLPDGFDQRADGIPFAVGFEGRPPSADGARGRELRRYCGGLPGGLRAGAPGVLLPRH